MQAITLACKAVHIIIRACKLKHGFMRTAQAWIYANRQSLVLAKLCTSSSSSSSSSVLASSSMDLCKQAMTQSLVLAKLCTPSSFSQDQVPAPSFCHTDRKQAHVVVACCAVGHVADSQLWHEPRHPAWPDGKDLCEQVRAIVQYKILLTCKALVTGKHRDACR